MKRRGLVATALVAAAVALATVTYVVHARFQPNAPARRTAVELDLPGPDPAAAARVLALGLSATGQVTIDGHAASETAIDAALRLAATRHENVVIVASPDAPYSLVPPLLQRANAAGVVGVSISTATP